jgi:hypothetical protein
MAIKRHVCAGVIGVRAGAPLWKKTRKTKKYKERRNQKKKKEKKEKKLLTLF